MRYSAHVFVDKVYQLFLLTPDINDLFDVKSELMPVAAEWRNIGLALGLSSGDLETINSKYHGDPNACITSTLTEWLKENYNFERFGEPTWQRLVKAVSDPAGGANIKLARKIANRHKAGGTYVM